MNLIKINPIPNSIPVTLAPFFQEYDLTCLDIERSAATVIERTLQFGNRAELCWLFSVYPQEMITDWLERWGDFGLPEPHLTFWKLMLQ